MKDLSCPFRMCSSPSGARPGNIAADTGYVLLLVMMMATLLLISLAVAAPSIYVEGQREKEKELIFRGEQYARAIELFHTKFHRYPTSVKELLHTDDLSFLKQRFRDPMAKNGKWRFIHATANGIILDSKILGPPGKNKNKPFGSNSSNSSSQGQQTSGHVAVSGSSNGGLGMGSFSLPGLNGNSGGSGQQNGSSFFGNKNKLIGAYIVGVASTSHQHSIGVFDHETQYDMWEFIGVPGAPGAPVITGPAAIPAPGGRPGTPGSQQNSNGGFHLGSTLPSASSSSSSDSPFGGNSQP